MTRDGADAMKRTEYMLCCGKRSGYDVYRSVLTDGKRFYVRWDGKVLDVTADKNCFTRKAAMR